MSQETQAASSPAEVEDVFKGEQVSIAEFSKYRQDGELPARFKPAVSESAPDDTQEETEETEAEEPEPEPDSEPEALQEPKPKSKRDKRIQQLLDETNELKRKLAEKQDVKPEPSPVQQQPQTQKEPTPDDLNPDGTPKFKTYEEFTKALARHEARQERAEWQREHEQKEAQKALQAKLDEARTRYDDADDVIFPANQAIQTAKIPLAVKEVFAQSDVFIDLCYVVGSDPEELKKFIALAQSNPRAAIGKIFEYERGIHEELAKPRDDKGQFTSKEAPEKKTTAPKPPSPVGGAASRGFDVNDEGISNEEWMRKRNQELARKT